MTFRSKFELSEAIPHIKDAPKDESIIENLCLRPERNQRSFPGKLLWFLSGLKHKFSIMDLSLIHI